MEPATIGLDLAESIFHVHVADACAAASSAHPGPSTGDLPDYKAKRPITYLDI